MKVARIALMAALVSSAGNLLATNVPLQTVSVVIFPQNTALPNCPMQSANGGFTTRYSTAAAENNTFLFDDFLPTPTAVLANVSVSLSLLADHCAAPNTFDVYLNQGYPGVDPYYTTVGTGYSASSTMNSCQTPAQFIETARTAPSLLAPDVAPYVRGGSNVITVDEKLDGSCSSFIEYVVVTLLYYDTLPSIVFDLSTSTPEDQRKVLMHRWRTETTYPYFSTFQIAAGQTDAARDGHIQIAATVIDAGGVPLPGMDLYVRVVDPPDPSTYVPSGQSYWGDNPYGWDNFLIPYVSALPNYTWQPVTTDANGRISLVLPVALDKPAGDNVQVQATTIWLPFFTPTRCSDALGCYASGVITNWRRVYIERDRMFKAGAFLTANAPHNATTLDVADISAFQNASSTNLIAGIVIHGTPASGSPQNYMETVYVKKAAGGRLTLNGPLQHDYVSARSSVTPTLYAGDAIGKYASDADVFPTYLDLAIDFFAAKHCLNPPACDSLYTDLVTLSEGSTVPGAPPMPNMVPFIPFVNSCNPESYCLEVAERFFDTRSGSQALPGHQHFFSAKADVSLASAWTGTVAATCKNGDATCGANNQYAGSVMIFNFAIGWAIGGASSAYAGQSEAPVIREVSAHELAHTFDVNPPISSTGGHCTNQSAQGGPQASNSTGHCLMNENRTNSERGDGFIGFHNDPWSTSEYRRIRARPDPVPQTWQTTATPNP